MGGLAGKWLQARVLTGLVAVLGGGALKCWAGAGGALLPFVPAPRPDGDWMARGGIGGAPLAPAASSLVI